MEGIKSVETGKWHPQSTWVVCGWCGLASLISPLKTLLILRIGDVDTRKLLNIWESHWNSMMVKLKLAASCSSKWRWVDDDKVPHYCMEPEGSSTPVVCVCVYVRCFPEIKIWKQATTLIWDKNSRPTKWSL